LELTSSSPQRGTPEICRSTKAVAEPPEDDDEDMAVFVGAQSCWLMLWNIN